MLLLRRLKKARTIRPVIPAKAGIQMGGGEWIPAQGRNDISSLIAGSIRSLFRRLSRQGGFGVVESLVAVTIFGVGVTAAIAALSTGSMAVSTLDQEATLQNLASSQLAYTKSYPYNDSALTYPTVDILEDPNNPNPVTLPAGYVITVGVSSFAGGNSDIQKITVTVTRTGESSMVVEDIKVNR